MKGAASEQEGKPATGHGRSEGREMKPCGGGGRPLATLELLGRNKSLYEKKIGYLYCFFFRIDDWLHDTGCLFILFYHILVSL